MPKIEKIAKLPDLGENLPGAEVIEWKIKVGETIKEDQVVASVETDKAVMEVVAPRDGTVEALHVDAGVFAKTHEPFFSYTDGEEDKPKAKKKDDSGVAGKLTISSDKIQTQAPSSAGTTRFYGRVLPKARMLARQNGVDLNSVIGTGNSGMITVEDVQSFIASKPKAAPATSSTSLEGYTPIKGPQKAMAEAMLKSKENVVPMTVVEEADISAWGKEDITCRLIRAICEGCKAEPELNSWYQDFQIKTMKEVNVGMAVDTPHGLLTAVINEAHSKSAKELRDELDTIKEQVADRSIPREKMQGATIYLSNFGKFAGLFATPVVPHPTVCIIGCGRIIERDGKRLLPISATANHCAVTGGQLTRYLKAFIDDLAKAK